jgi:hypothetical protein
VSKEEKFVYRERAIKLISTIVFIIGGRVLNNLYFGAIFPIIIKDHVIFGRTKLWQKRKKLKNSWKKKMQNLNHFVNKHRNSRLLYKNYGLQEILVG